MSREARQWVTFRPGARIAVIAASLAAAASLVLPTTALAATTIGLAVGNQDCPFGESTVDTVQELTDLASPSYMVPNGGTSISAWFFQAAGTDSGSVSLLVWTPAGPGAYTLEAVSPAVDLSVTTSSFDLTAPIPVQPGDLIGLRLTGDTTCLAVGLPGDQIGFSGSATAVHVTVSMIPGPAERLNVQAGVEMTSNPVATTADQCKKGGWQKLSDSHGTRFKNLGDCVSFVATGGKNLAAGSTSPAASSTTPATSATTPATSATTPATSTTTPADSATTPAAGSTTPTDSAMTPADSATTPADSATTPADSATTPAADSTTSANSATTPADSATTPAAGSTTPADSATPPADGGTTPAAG